VKIETSSLILIGEQSNKIQAYRRVWLETKHGGANIEHRTALASYQHVVNSCMGHHESEEFILKLSRKELGSQATKR